MAAKELRRQHAMKLLLPRAKLNFVSSPRALLPLLLISHDVGIKERKGEERATLLRNWKSAPTTQEFHKQTRQRRLRPTQRDSLLGSGRENMYTQIEIEACCLLHA